MQTISQSDRKILSIILADCGVDISDIDAILNQSENFDPEEYRKQVRKDLGLDD